jgi:hypothetical protein
LHPSITYRVVGAREYRVGGSAFASKLGNGSSKGPSGEGEDCRGDDCVEVHLDFRRVDNLCWYQRSRCKKVCKLREAVSLAAVGISTVLVVVVDCADVCADDVRFFQVGEVVYIDMISSHRSSFSRSDGSNMSKSG